MTRLAAFWSAFQIVRALDAALEAGAASAAQKVFVSFIRAGGRAEQRSAVQEAATIRGHSCRRPTSNLHPALLRTRNILVQHSRP